MSKMEDTIPQTSLLGDTMKKLRKYSKLSLSNDFLIAKNRPTLTQKRMCFPEHYWRLEECTVKEIFIKKRLITKLE